jgi:hypothetical protein
MNTRDILNKYLYPESAQNVRRKDDPYYDQVTLAAGTLEYFFFVTALGNIFQRNKRLPLAGTEVFFIEAISAYPELNIDTTALANAMNELIQQSYLQISIDGRIQQKIPGLDFIQYTYGDTFSDQVVVTALQPRIQLTKRKLPLPIIMNATSSFEFKFVTTAAAATAFADIPLNLVLHGIQLDKLDSFYWDNLKNRKFQQVPVTYYNTQVIASAAQATTQFFANPAQAQNLFSQTFPLSDITTFSCHSIEVFVNQPDTPIEPTTIYNSRLHNVLQIRIDDVDWYNANLQDMLSLFAGFDTALTTTPDTDIVNFLNVRQTKILKVPLEFPANSKVLIQLTQPAASLGITGEITIALRGIETRRVA